MIHLKFSANAAPGYMTSGSSGADLRSTVDAVIPAGGRGRVPTGVWIKRVDWDLVPDGMIPELQIRARSGLAFKFGVNLTNGIGTIDADYPDEIGVLLSNTGTTDFEIKQGDRIAQMVLILVHRIPGISVGSQRVGGFGSTGTTKSQEPSINL